MIIHFKAFSRVQTSVRMHMRLEEKLAQVHMHRPMGTLRHPMAGAQVQWQGHTDAPKRRRVLRQLPCGIFPRLRQVTALSYMAKHVCVTRAHAMPTYAHTSTLLGTKAEQPHAWAGCTSSTML
jgi:hypothetical protein